MITHDRRLTPSLPFGYRRHGDLFYNGEMTSLYYARDMRDLVSRPLNRGSSILRKTYTSFASPYALSTLGRRYTAGLELMERLTNRYRKPEFGIDSIVCRSGCLFNIEIEVVETKPFCQLLHFKKCSSDGKAIFTGGCVPLKQPKLLLVAPYSGHYATLLRDTVKTLLLDHDVYITDWENARDVPLIQGNFTLDDYIDYLIHFLEVLGPNTHIMGVCQPAVPVLAAVSILAGRDSPVQPPSMTLMGGPIDTRQNPTKVNSLARTRPIEWFRHSVIGRVPHYYPGAMRHVCPGFLMLQGFMSLNLETHLQSNKKLFAHLTKGDEESADAHRRFYDEYRAVLDLPADYFLDSVSVAFQKHSLPKGTMTWRGIKVDPSLIKKTALLTVEGEKDDISGVCQTQAAHTICANIPEDMRHHHLQAGVGHYGVFNGRRWREEIEPVVAKFTHTHDLTLGKKS